MYVVFESCKLLYLSVHRKCNWIEKTSTVYSIHVTYLLVFMFRKEVFTSVQKTSKIMTWQ